MSKKEIIIETYRRLVVERQSAEIPVAVICKEANVSRKTFYNHFQDRFEVIEQILIMDIERPLLKVLKMNCTHHEGIKMIFDSLLLERDFYRIAIMENGKNSLFETLISRLQALNHRYDHENDKQDFTQDEREYLNYRFSCELALMIRKWMEDGMKESSDFMAKIIVYPKNDHKK
ncbi:MAG: TetR/AcrR family transcriptional regulator C-terminal domain-containing protein [Traorella sp.]